MALKDVIIELRNMADEHRELADISMELADKLQNMTLDTVSVSGGDGFFITGLTIFVLACFVGYYVVWKVTPALHSPLMAVTNAISSVIIVGALVAAGPIEMSVSRYMGLAAVVLASINIFGGFIVTERMLSMYRKKATGKEKVKR
ncbi:MAG: NAD(P) transhydrogenase subunit alpha [Alphaproteobacteria bacterium]|nr:NAD(P) transhydrogenase subunit alpha [Alphaproteobacteria bacterium]MCL2505969.1 NAD(P) transhydrogenase subunit alpha [Alphaproteobacteria bacterium]